MNVSGYALITGGGSGIGRACALLFAELGAAGLLIADSDSKSAREVAFEASGLTHRSDFLTDYVEVDVTDEKSVEAMFLHMTELFGRMDYCVHSAGISLQSYNPVAKTSSQEFQKLMSVNAHGTFLVTKSACIVMAQQPAKPVSSDDPERGIIRGAIVNVASVTAIVSPPNMGQYNASKQAVQAVTTTAAIENAPLRIRVNCVCPVWAEDPVPQVCKHAIAVSDGEAAEFRIPMKRTGTAREAAHSVIFLCSSWSSYITGHSLVVDGGMTIF
ncbi:hypothetical protein F4777DRAFT_588882 [Nemania sp. FL0916]|nr:hypothetical protein F4777DRAFT_588882 [Nemania sp. FL0916]